MFQIFDAYNYCLSITLKTNITCVSDSVLLKMLHVRMYTLKKQMSKIILEKCVGWGLIYVLNSLIKHTQEC